MDSQKYALEKFVKSIPYDTLTNPEIEDSEVYFNLVHSQVNWSTVPSYEKKFNKLVSQFPQFESLRPEIEKLKVMASDIKTLVENDKTRKLEKRSKQQEKAANTTKNGVKLGRASKGIVESLMLFLKDQRNEHVKDAVESILRNIESNIAFFEKTAPNESNQYYERVLRQYGVFVKPELRNRDGVLSILKGEEFQKQQSGKAKRDAEAGFDSFIIKMALKIEEKGAKEVTSVKFDGRPWDGLMNVETDSGLQKWRTKRIVNTSPLGTRFCQWPTTDEL